MPKVETQQRQFKKDDLDMNDFYPSSSSSSVSTSSNSSSTSNSYKKPLTRSYTDHHISATLIKSSPFVSVLPSAAFNSAPSNNTSKIINTPITEQKEVKKIDTIKETEPTGAKKTRCLYTIDFLLGRSDASLSKKVPNNWKEKKEEFPTICFCSKEIASYFNPYKYYDHWNKIQSQNYELHNQIHMPATSAIKKSASNNRYSFKNLDDQSIIHNNEHIKFASNYNTNINNYNSNNTQNMFHNNIKNSRSSAVDQKLNRNFAQFNLNNISNSNNNSSHRKQFQTPNESKFFTHQQEQYHQPFYQNIFSKSNYNGSNNSGKI